VRGKVLERIDASGYSYLRLATSEGERWAAVPETTQQVGAEVTVTGGMPMDGFQSKTLKRRFDRIVFGVLAGADARGAALRPGAMGSGSYHGRRSGEALLEPIDIATIQVPRAPGEDGYTLAELYAKRRTLQDREIQVRGKVIKVTESVMGRNWVHLADGTGSGRARDLTLTTQDSALVGDVVLARGLLRIDRDFGAGYTYPLILEDARLSR
jgi:membrane protein implicated in regulation of membrane protease activity